MASLLAFILPVVRNASVVIYHVGLVVRTATIVNYLSSTNDLSLYHVRSILSDFI